MRRKTTAKRAKERAGRARIASCLLCALCAVVPLGCCCSSQTFTARGGNATGVGAYDPEQPNPLFVETRDPEALWDAIVDTLDNYYVIETEIPVRTYEQDSGGQTYLYRTEGRLETRPSIMGGVQEPWRKNGASCGNRWFATFQTVRSSAVVRVVPEGEGFFIYLSVLDEIEDMAKPIGSSIGYSQKFREDVSQLTQTVGERAPSKGWIPIGRDDDLERQIMEELAWRVGTPRTVLHAGLDSDLSP